MRDGGLLVVVLVAGACGASEREEGSAQQADVPRLESVDSRRKKPVPLVRPSVAIEGGAVVGRLSHCKESENELRTDGKRVPVALAPDVPVMQTVKSFRIDANTTPCEDWEECLARGACKRVDADYCSDDKKAVLTHASAEAYCVQRGARLPTWNEWTRAVRGDSHDSRPFGNGENCPLRGSEKRPRRCVHRTSSGFTLMLETPTAGEWTSEIECDGDRRLNVFVALMHWNVDVSSTWLDAAAFRCVHLAANLDD